MNRGSLTEALRETLALFDECEPPKTTTEVAERLDLGRRSTYERLERLVEQDQLETKKVGGNGRVWWRPQGDAESSPDWEATAASLIDDVLDDAEVGVFVLDADFDVVWINDTTERYFGLDRETALGRDKRTLVDEQIANTIENSEAFADTVLATYDDNTYTERFECHVTAGDGRADRWLEHRSKPIESGAYAGGRVELYYDVTDRKRIENTHRTNRAQFESFVDAVEEYAIFLLDTDGYVQSWNSGARRIKGYDPEEIIGEHFSTFYTEEDRSAGVPADKLTAAAEAGSVEDEGWRVRADGSRFWGAVTLTAIRDADGDLEGYAKVTRDMTEQRERERQLRRERDLNDRLFETAPVRLVVFGTDGTIERINSQGRRELGVEGSDDYILESITLFDEDGEQIPPDQHPVQRVLETGDTVSNVVVQHEAPSGERRWASLTATPLYDDGDLDRIIVAGRDITAQKERERQLSRQRDELKRELDDVFDRIDDAVHGLDRKWRFTYLNDRAEELFGRTEEELLGKSVWDEFPAASERSYRDRYERAMETQEPVVFEEYSDAADAWLEVSVYPSETGLSIYFRDVTERRRRQRELERYEQIVETVWDGVYALDENDRFVLVNDAFCGMVGYERDELLGEHPTLLNSEEVNESANAMEAEIAAGEREIGILEYEFERSDGETVPVETRFGPIEYGDGHIGRCGVARDVSQRREYERELESRARQQEVVSELGKFALEDPDLDELFAEATRRVDETLGTEYCKVLDLDANGEELFLRQGIGWRDGTVGEETVSAVEADSQASYTLQSNGPVVVTDLETDARFSGPELLTSHAVQSGISTVIGSGESTWGVLGVHDTEARSFTDEDIDFVQSVANILAEAIERKQYQDELQSLIDDLEESNERLEQFAYVTSHDLQEPLRMVSSYLSLIEERYDDELDEDGQEFLEFAVDGADRMREMIDGLLQYSRVDTEAEPLEPTDCDAVVEDVLGNLQVQIEETDAAIEAGSLPTVTADRKQLTQVFQNLLSNAIKYRGDNRPEIEIDAERGADEWVFRVSDNGIGMSPEETDRIFEIFQRLHTDEYAGTGIGLALCKKIVDRHGGELWVESAPSTGSTFYFTIPTAGDLHDSP